ncbi:MAG: ATPase domain-containing protein [Candidatus Eisenbacteria bacterium]
MDGTFRTGIGLLDDHIGGFFRGKPYLVFGEAGTGKTLLGLQYALGGGSKEPAILMTIERPADLLAQAASLALDPYPAVERGDLCLLEYDQDVTSRLMRYGWKRFLEPLAELRAEAAYRRIVFDPIHPLFGGSTEEGRLRYDLRYLTETLAEWGWTPLFLNDRGATQGHPSLYRVFSDICQGIFELQDEVESLESSKRLFIHKLRQPSDRMRKIPFQIVPGAGLVETRVTADGERDASTSRASASASQVSAPRSSGGPAGPPAVPHPRKRVLLADDDPFIRSLLRKALRSEFDLLMAEDGVEALTRTVREAPDVILLDVQLPKLSGFDVCRALRGSGFHQPILFVSGIQDRNERVRGLSLGGNDFISKPFELREVIEKVRNASRLFVAPAAPPAADVEDLLSLARVRALPPEEFRTHLQSACEDARAFARSLGVVRLLWDPSSDTPASIPADLECLSRPDDLLTFPCPGEALVVLHAETIEGTLGFIARLRREWPRPQDGEPPHIRCSYDVVEPIDGVPFADPDEVMRRAREPEFDLFRYPGFAAYGTRRLAVAP